MEKKTIFYILGGVAILGVGYYLWSKRKKSAEEKEEGEEKDTAETKEGAETTTDATNTKKAEAKTPTGTAVKTEPKKQVKKLSASELESKLQSRCGKKPKLKKNKKKYEQCRNEYKAKLKSEGYIDFTGDSESVVSDGFYSSFDSSLNLDL
jgi:LPXTG-motif cell wall-anchored protein